MGIRRSEARFGRRALVAGAFALAAACGSDYTRIEGEPPGEEEPLPAVVPERPDPAGQPLETTGDPGQEQPDSVDP